MSGFANGAAGKSKCIKKERNHFCWIKVPRESKLNLYSGFSFLMPALRNKSKQNTAVDNNESPLLVEAAEKSRSSIGPWPEKKQNRRI